MVTKRIPEKKAARKRPARKGDGFFWDELIEIGQRMPAAERAKHPRDGARNLEHYLYGRAKAKDA